MVNIIPYPAKVKENSGQFTVVPQTQVFYQRGFRGAGKIARQLAELLSNRLGTKVKPAATESTTQVRGAIVLIRPKTSAKLGKEGYRLKVKPYGVVIEADKPAGLFYGMQSLRQLIFANKTSSCPLTVPCVRIEDVPRFAWRGMHYDPCRNFLGLSHVFELIDFLASQKFNVLHLHLTEDQGWRVEIQKYPKLTEVSAWRNGTKNHYWQSSGDRKKHGGFYSQQDIQAIVRYAADRFITVVPEIEAPGHSQAALAAYPELSCTGGPHKVMTRWGISKDVYCVGNEKVFAFLEHVLDEIISLFPSQYIHIGGDECPKDRWKKCPQCQKRMKTENLADEDELQSYFIRRLAKFVGSRGRKIIGWDEILDGGLAPHAAVMSWRSFEGGWKASSLGHPVVMTPSRWTYLDHKPTEDTLSGSPHCLPIETVYAFEPSEGFKPAWKKHILGGQGATWSEYINNSEEFLHHLFPRCLALAEVFWSPQGKRDFDSFKKRICETSTCWDWPSLD